MNFVDGFYIKDLIIFGELDKTGYASKGFEIQPPDLRNGAVEMLHEYEDKLRRLLVTIQPPARVQWMWNVNSDYKNPLQDYDERTETLAKNEWSYKTRKERYHRYMKRMEEGRLRREKLRIYISIPVPARKRTKDFKSDEEKLHFYDACLKGLQSYFDTQLQLMKHIFGAGTHIKALYDEDHFLHHAEFFNPSYAYRSDCQPLKNFDKQQSILANSFKSGISGNERTDENDYSFFSDGFFHNLLTLKRWPQNTFQSIVFRLTSLRFLDYSLTVNIIPGDVKKEITMEEKSIERLRGDYRSTGKESLLNAIEKKQQKIKNLTSGSTYPLQVEYIIHLWSDSLEDLSGKTAAVKAAINLMESAQFWEPTLSTQSINLFTQTVPGWIFGKYDAHAIYAESEYFAAMLPFSATFTGHLEGAEALYDGDNFNLVGIRNFIGSTPQHCGLFGMSGSGKSAYMCDLLSQTQPYYGYTVIIEKGLSYGVYTATMGSTPIIIHPDTDLTINYLDTHGLPLSSGQISNATALVSQMCGKADSNEQQNLRYAMIMSYIEMLYQDSYDNWLKSHKHLIQEITSTAIVSLHYKIEKMPPGSSLVEAFLEVKELRNAEDPDIIKRLKEVSLEEISRFVKGAETSDIVRNFAFAYFKPEEFPIHSELQELMLAVPLSHHDTENVRRIATLLSAWNAGGSYGPLFDGHTNITLTGKLAHFELGYISEADIELKKLAAFLITNYTRNHILGLPRKIKKRYIFEEAGSLLNMPGGESLISEAYAQMRKFGTWIISIVQQYTQFKNTSIRPIIMGNSKQFFIMKQADRGDLADLADADRGGINLPEVTQEGIMNYPSPENLPTDDIYSSFTYFHLDQHMPKVGTCRNYCSPEMLYCSSSSGEDFDQRMREIKSEDNPVDAIIKYCQKDQSNKEGK